MTIFLHCIYSYLTLPDSLICLLVYLYTAILPDPPPIPPRLLHPTRRPIEYSHHGGLTLSLPFTCSIPKLEYTQDIGAAQPMFIDSTKQMEILNVRTLRCVGVEGSSLANHTLEWLNQWHSPFALFPLNVIVVLSISVACPWGRAFKRQPHFLLSSLSPSLSLMSKNINK